MKKLTNTLKKHLQHQLLPLLLRMLIRSPYRCEIRRQPTKGALKPTQIKRSCPEGWSSSRIGSTHSHRAYHAAHTPERGFGLVVEQRRLHRGRMPVLGGPGTTTGQGPRGEELPRVVLFAHTHRHNQIHMPAASAEVNHERVSQAGHSASNGTAHSVAEHNCSSVAGYSCPSVAEQSCSKAKPQHGA
eukprot:scaffold31359_cov20-Tisochrysis_lutea.AAC.3